MCPMDDIRSSLGQGSGDLQLELAISQLRSAMLHAINELDLFTESVKLARARIDAAFPGDTRPPNNN